MSIDTSREARSFDDDPAGSPLISAPDDVALIPDEDQRATLTDLAREVSDMVHELDDRIEDLLARHLQLAHQAATAYELATAYRNEAVYQHQHAMERVSAERRSTPKEQLVYFIKCGEWMKIGISVNPEKRLEALRRSGNGTAAPVGIQLHEAEIVHTMPGGRPVEKFLHHQFRHLRVEGEWFNYWDELEAYVDGLTERAA